MTEKVKGKIKFFLSEKGYGFIESNGQDYFFHHSELTDGDEFYKDDDVEFEIKQTEKGFSAININVTK